ncbi:MAG: 2-C-methyl-D-erythritol 2,4-cyclodiphosphate synthase [Gemmatimonadales bacterium]|nr:2-C-methyl-D-erythritol 2,4-cyclodiphosphate synthase [Gemmatimonadales bacterium]
MSIRSGIGYDSHRFAAGRPLRLGGVTVPHTHGLVGHSDGDVVLHAIVDALLGAAALGDIGSYFPDDDPQWKGADSLRFVKGAVDALAGGGLAVNQVDVTVITERPKLAPHIGAMRAATARALGVPMEMVSIKAKTNEGMGWVGRSEGIGAIAVATVCPAGTG